MKHDLNFLVRIAVGTWQSSCALSQNMAAFPKAIQPVTGQRKNQNVHFRMQLNVSLLLIQTALGTSSYWGKYEGQSCTGCASTVSVGECWCCGATLVFRGQLKCVGTLAETRFSLSAKRTSPFKSAGRVSSVDYCVWAVVMLDTPCSEVVWRVLATHSIRQFPLHFLFLCHRVHSVQQKSIGLIFRTSRSGSDVWYSCHHNSSRFTFPMFVHSWCFSIFHSLQSITPRIY
jgi:hypothetical protein